MDGWLAVRFVHVVAMAFFVGGQRMLAAVVVPVLRGGDRAKPEFWRTQRPPEIIAVAFVLVLVVLALVLVLK